MLYYIYRNYPNLNYSRLSYIFIRSLKDRGYFDQIKRKLAVGPIKRSNLTLLA